jgi:hypothetical protein
MLVCSVGLSAQNNQPKLNQVELCKKLNGAWQIQTDKDTITGFEMITFKNAVLETAYLIVKGEKELTATCNLYYDAKADNFKGYLINWKGKVSNFYFKFTSEKEFMWEWVEDFTTNKLLARNKFVLADPDHLNGEHFKADLVKTGTSQWVRTGLGH